MIDQITIVNGQPKLGRKFDYYLAMKHRSKLIKLINATPWWQFKKLKRRGVMYDRAWDRFHDSAQNLIQYPHYGEHDEKTNKKAKT